MDFDIRTTKINTSDKVNKRLHCPQLQPCSSAFLLLNTIPDTHTLKEKRLIWLMVSAGAIHAQCGKGKLLTSHSQEAGREGRSWGQEHTFQPGPTCKCGISRDIFNLSHKNTLTCSCAWATNTDSAVFCHGDLCLP